MRRFVLLGVALLLTMGALWWQADASWAQDCCGDGYRCPQNMCAGPDTCILTCQPIAPDNPEFELQSYLEMGIPFNFNWMSPALLGVVITAGLRWFFAIIGLTFFMYMMYGGFVVSSGQGRPEALDNGKKIITRAVVGLLVLFCSFWLIQLVELVLGISILGIGSGGGGRVSPRIAVVSPDSRATGVNPVDVPLAFRFPYGNWPEIGDDLEICWGEDPDMAMRVVNLIPNILGVDDTCVIVTVGDEVTELGGGSFRFLIPDLLDFGTNYQWRVRVLDENGEATETSPNYEFRTMIDPALLPTPVVPSASPTLGPGQSTPTPTPNLEPQDYTVMTYNVMADPSLINQGAGQCAPWLPTRRAKVVETIENSGADVVLLQEVLPIMREDLHGSLRGYEVVPSGVGLVNDYQLGIVFKPSRFELVNVIDSNCLGSLSDGSDMRCIRATLKDRATGEQIEVFNNHVTRFPNSEEDSEMKQEFINKYRNYLTTYGDDLVIIGGDFSSTTDDSDNLASALVDSGMQFVSNSYQKTNSTMTANPNTCTGLRNQLPFDHLLVSGRFQVLRGSTLDNQTNGVYPSRHRPVLGVVRMSPNGRTVPLDATKKLKAMTWNIYVGNSAGLEAFADYIISHQIEVASLQEVKFNIPGVFANEGQALVQILESKGYPMYMHSAAHEESEGEAGLVLLSKYPMLERTTHAAYRKRNVISALLDTPIGHIRVVNMHLTDHEVDNRFENCPAVQNSIGYVEQTFTEPNLLILSDTNIDFNYFETGARGRSSPGDADGVDRECRSRIQNYERTCVYGRDNCYWVSRATAEYIVDYALVPRTGGLKIVSSLNDNIVGISDQNYDFDHSLSDHSPVTAEVALRDPSSLPTPTPGQAVPTQPTDQPTSEVKLLSYNILNSMDTNRCDGWTQQRKVDVAKVITSDNPDILAVQEMSDLQWDDLTTLTGRQFVPGKLANEWGSYIGLTNRFDVLSAGRGCFGGGEENIRRCAFVQLRDKQNNMIVYVYNLHLAPAARGQGERESQIVTVMNQIRSSNHFPVVIMGDLNSNEANIVNQYLRQENSINGQSLSFGLTDTYQTVANRPLIGSTNDACGKKVVPLGDKIDYIYTSSDAFTTVSAEVWPVWYESSQFAPSDHLPVRATVRPRSSATPPASVSPTSVWATIQSLLLPLDSGRPAGTSDSFKQTNRALTATELPANVGLNVAAGNKVVNIGSWNVGKGWEDDDDENIMYNYDKDKAPAIVQAMESHNLDVLLIQEAYAYPDASGNVTKSVIADLRSLLDGQYYMYHNYHSGNTKDFGNMIISRYPLRNTGYFDIHRGGRRVILGQVDTPYGGLVVYSLHVNRNDACSGANEVLQYARGNHASVPFVLAGDYNLELSKPGGSNDVQNCGGGSWIDFASCSGPTTIAGVNTCYADGIDFFATNTALGPDKYQVVAKRIPMHDSHEFYVSSVVMR